MYLAGVYVLEKILMQATGQICRLPFSPTPSLPHNAASCRTPASGCPRRGQWLLPRSSGSEEGTVWPGRGALWRWAPSGSLTASACSPPGVCPLVSRGLVLWRWRRELGGGRPQGTAAAACWAGTPHRGGLAGAGVLFGDAKILQIILAAWQRS